ncbi:hypothetical protein Tco_0994877 [Tanacetum coccineum]
MRFVVCAIDLDQARRSVAIENGMDPEIEFIEARIEELKGELYENGAQLRRCEASLTFWKSTFLAFVICMVLVFAMK